MKRYIRSSSMDGMSVKERRSLAKSSNDLEILAQLANDADTHVRETVANRITDPDILAKLANDSYAGVRATVAERTTDPEILAKLADDEYWGVRYRVAGRADDPDILAKLADDEEECVRAIVAERRGTQVRTANKTQRSPKWSKIIEQLRNDYESGIDDPFYEQSDAADYILGLASDVNSSLGYYVEPSVQAGQGSVWVYDENSDDEVIVDGYDFATFDDEIGEIALDSSSPADFKEKYKQYLQSLVENE